MSAFDELVLALRTDLDNLKTFTALERNRNRQAGLRLACAKIRATVDEFEAAGEAEPEPASWPDAWDDFATCSKCGRRNPPSLATTHGGLMCHPQCPSTAQYLIKGGAVFGDIVIEVPVAITNPGLIATHLQERLTVLTRPLIHAEYGIDWMVSLHDDYPGAPEPFASLSIDGHKSVQYPLIEAPRGGAK